MFSCLNFFIIFYLFSMCACVCVYVQSYICISWFKWAASSNRRLQNKMQGWILSFHHTGFWSQTQVMGLSSTESSCWSPSPFSPRSFNTSVPDHGGVYRWQEKSNTDLKKFECFLIYFSCPSFADQSQIPTNLSHGGQSSLVCLVCWQSLG